LRRRGGRRSIALLGKSRIWLSALSTLLLGACAVSHSGKPPGVVQPAAVATRYSEQKALTYTPLEWPQQLRADVYVPEGAGPHPGILMVHGGGWVTGDRSIMSQLSERLARRGYVVVNIDYRLAPQFHHPAQMEDLRAAVQWMRANAASFKLAPDKIGAWGYSAGAHLVALLGTDGEGAATRIQAVVAGGLPSNLNDFPNGPVVLALMGTTRDADPGAWANASPYSRANANAAPMFIYHGTWDTTVRVTQAEKMNAAMQAAGAPVELYLLHGYGHNTTFLFGSAAENEAIAFLDRNLRR
jgi:acetyl esterase/lipase